jgi:hypothetical protein
MWTALFPRAVVLFFLIAVQAAFPSVSLAQGNPLQNFLGNILQGTQQQRVAAAQTKWAQVDPVIRGCVQQTVRANGQPTTIDALTNMGIGPDNTVVSEHIVQCEQIHNAWASVDPAERNCIEQTVRLNGQSVTIDELIGNAIDPNQSQISQSLNLCRRQLAQSREEAQAHATAAQQQIQAPPATEQAPRQKNAVGQSPDDVLIIFNPSGTGTVVTRDLRGEIRIDHDHPTNGWDVCLSDPLYYNMVSDSKPPIFDGYKGYLNIEIAKRYPGLDISGGSHIGINPINPRGSNYCTLYVLPRSALEGIPQNMEILMVVPWSGFLAYKAGKVHQAEVAANGSAAKIAAINAGSLTGAGLLAVYRDGNICVEGSDDDMWQGLFRSDAEKFNSKPTLSFVVGDLNTIFETLKADKCAYFFGSAEAIKTLVPALNRDGHPSLLDSYWVSDEQVSELRKEIAEEKERRLAAKKAAQEQAAAAAQAQAEEEARCNSDSQCNAAKAAAAAKAQEANAEKDREDAAALAECDKLDPQSWGIVMSTPEDRRVAVCKNMLKIRDYFGGMK